MFFAVASPPHEVWLSWGQQRQQRQAKTESLGLKAARVAGAPKRRITSQEDLSSASQESSITLTKPAASPGTRTPVLGMLQCEAHPQLLHKD